MGPRRRAPGPSLEEGNRGRFSVARGVGADAAGPAGLEGGGRTPARGPGPGQPGPRPPRPLPLPTCVWLRGEAGAWGEGAVLPSVRAAPQVLTPRTAAAAAVRPSPWSTGLTPVLSLYAASESLCPSRSVCFCFVLPSNTGARGRRLLAEERRPAGQSWR